MTASIKRRSRDSPARFQQYRAISRAGAFSTSLQRDRRTLSFMAGSNIDPSFISIVMPLPSRPEFETMAKRKSSSWSTAPFTTSEKPTKSLQRSSNGRRSNPLRAKKRAHQETQHEANQPPGTLFRHASGRAIDKWHTDGEFGV